MRTNTAPTQPVRMHGSYGIAAHDKRRPVPTARRRWPDRTDAPFDPNLVAFRCS